MIPRRASLIKKYVKERLQPSRNVQSLAGTVVEHQAAVFLHTREPPSSYPAKFTSPLQRALLLRLLPLKTVVNFGWRDDLNRLDGVDFATNEEEAYPATLFLSQTKETRFFPKISADNCGDIVETIQSSSDPLKSGNGKGIRDEDVQLYVCTHGARDCRCGDIGGALVQALKEELHARVRSSDDKLWKKVKIGETGHVGGHKYAANLIVYPYGDWFGLLVPEDASKLLDALKECNIQSNGRKGGSSTSNDYREFLSSHWRGRAELSKEEQTRLSSGDHTAGVFRNIQNLQ